jgi:DNA-binding protein HU-beta
MTRKELIEVLASETKLSKREVKDILDKFASIVMKTVKKGEKVSITGFGTFDLGKRAARRGRDPQTGEIIRIPEMKMPRFRAGNNLKKEVR